MGTGVVIQFIVTNKAGNESAVLSNTYDIVPYILTYITEVSGKLKAVRRWNASASSWENTNYDEVYSYRIGGSDAITLNGLILIHRERKQLNFQAGQNLGM